MARTNSAAPEQKLPPPAVVDKKPAKAKKRRAPARQARAVEPAPEAEAKAVPEKSRERARVLQLQKDRLEFVDRDGRMLRYELTIQPRDGGPDPVNIPLNDETFVIKRGAMVVVPWYVVSHMANNVEQKFKPQRDDKGRRIMIPEDRLAEPFQARPVNPPANGRLPY